MVGKITGYGIPKPTINNNNLKREGIRDSRGKFGKIFDSLIKENNKKELSFSSHAMKRIEERGINLTEERVNKLKEAVDLAERKGAKDCLIMLDDTAFIVNVKNKKVITAVDEGSMRGNVFTNIDSAILSY
jgi:flagellar operon protein